MVTIKELQRELGIKTYLDAYRWIIQNGYRDAYSIRFTRYASFNRGAADKRKPLSVFILKVQEVKAQAMDEVFKTLQP
jgi:hypothetical protein